MTTFTILTVCTGNIARSPLAAQLLRFESNDLPSIRVHSAGTGALVGAPMMPQSKAIATRLGVPATEEHVARQITERHVLEADLVLAMSREHRRSSVELTPRALRKAFTVREFARLANELPPGALAVSEPMLTDDVGDRLRAAVEAVASMRGALPPLDDPRDDDVIDPYRQSDAVYEQSAAQLTPAVRAVSALLHRAAFGTA